MADQDQPDAGVPSVKKGDTLNAEHFNWMFQTLAKLDRMLKRIDRRTEEIEQTQAKVLKRIKDME